MIFRVCIAVVSFGLAAWLALGTLHAATGSDVGDLWGLGFLPLGLAIRRPYRFGLGSGDDR